MAQYWCNHCCKLVEMDRKGNDEFLDFSVHCPFCGAGDPDLFSVKDCKIKIPPGAKHGDDIGYPD